MLPAKCHRRAHHRRAIGCGRCRHDASGKKRQAGRDNARTVARQAIGHKSRHTLVLHHAGNQVSNDGGGGIGIIRDHNHIARFRFQKRAINADHISRIGERGKRRADKDRIVGVHRLDAVIKGTAAFHGIRQMRCLRAAKGFN